MSTIVIPIRLRLLGGTNARVMSLISGPSWQLLLLVPQPENNAPPAAQLSCKAPFVALRGTWGEERVNG